MQHLSPQDIILKYLNEPEDELLTEKVNTLRNSSTENEILYQEIKKLWDISAQTGRLNEINHKISIKTFKNKLNHSIDGTTQSFKWFKNAAAIFIAIGLGFWLYSKNTTVDYIVKETKNQIDSVSLSDGTKVILALNSAISYPEKFTGEERLVNLVKGQAFFKVSHDKKHPFNVLIRHSKVKVLGTSFNINYTPSEISVAVKTGVVKFSPDGKSDPAILTAGHGISYNFIESKLTFEEGANSNSWLTKELRFVDLPLDQVCTELSDYYHVNIILYDKMPTTKKFNATFTDSSLEEVLTVLKETYQINITKEESTIIIRNIHN